MAHHDRVRQVAEQRDAAAAACRASPPPAPRAAPASGAGSASARLPAGGSCQHQPARNPLVQQQLGGADERIGVKPALPDAGHQRVGDGDERHPDVMRHVTSAPRRTAGPGAGGCSRSHRGIPRARAPRTPPARARLASARSGRPSSASAEAYGAMTRSRPSPRLRARSGTPKARYW